MIIGCRLEELNFVTNLNLLQFPGVCKLSNCRCAINFHNES